MSPTYVDIRYAVLDSYFVLRAAVCSVSVFYEAPQYSVLYVKHNQLLMCRCAPIFPLSTFEVSEKNQIDMILASIFRRFLHYVEKVLDR